MKKDIQVSFILAQLCLHIKGNITKDLLEYMGVHFSCVSVFPWCSVGSCQALHTSKIELVYASTTRQLST